MSPTTKVTVGGVKGRVTLEAIIDTGFDGDICIPVKTATELGLELVGQDEFELADGSKKRGFIFEGFAILLGKKRVVEISLTDSEETLVGTNLRAGCKLTVDFASGKVNLTRL